MSLPEALRTFLKEHADLVDQHWTPEADAALVAVQTQYYTSTVPAGTPIPTASPEVTPGPVSAPVASKEAQKSVNFDPAIRKPKDHVSVGKPADKDTGGEDLLSSPGKIKTQPNATSPEQKKVHVDKKVLGPDTSATEANLGKCKTSPNKVKLPNTDLGKDTEGNDPFAVPGLKAKPSVSKK